MTTRARRVLVVGPTYADLVFGGLERLPVWGEEVFASSFRVTAGGSAITAIALARLGHRVALVADLGDDVLGAAVRRVLDEEGIDATFASGRAGATTPVTAVMSGARDRAFATYLGAGRAASDLAAALRTTDAEHVHVAGFPAVLADPDVVASARAAGAQVSFDPGWDERALGDARVRAVARAVDVLLPNRMEAARLVATAPGAAADDASAEALLGRLAAERATGVTVVKDGAAGAWACGPDGAAQHVAAPVVDAVDPTGAGDVFDAGFLDAWWAGLPLDACLARGAWCGARATTAYGGATAAPTRAELEERA
ncbi:MAG: carbohydrate kinase family protein [Trueperaceae bacterium]